jgi:hypothetical protein
MIPDVPMDKRGKRFINNKSLKIGTIKKQQNQIEQKRFW